jgi:hypothetical protein
MFKVKRTYIKKSGTKWFSQVSVENAELQTQREEWTKEQPGFVNEGVIFISEDKLVNIKVFDTQENYQAAMIKFNEHIDFAPILQYGRNVNESIVNEEMEFIE